MLLNEMIKLEVYSLEKRKKEKILNNILNLLTVNHYNNCVEYNHILKSLLYNVNKNYNIEELPFIPVRLFKEYDLYSVPKNKIVKTMTSSGTSGQKVAKIYLDDESTRIQIRILARIISSFVGEKRLPTIILDTEMVKKDRSMFSARGAGTVGFSVFGHDICYALNDKMKLDIEAIKIFIEKNKNTPILLFGYTYIIWEYIVKCLQKNKICLDISRGFLFHSGGWKKIESEKVDTGRYNKVVQSVLGNIQIHNYYGMAEQLGSIFVECEHGVKHCSIFSDIIIRRAHDFSCAAVGERGLIELVSVLPTSYPGHILLTEDEGEIIGEDDCPCGRLGKTFKIHGRIKNAEVRGCSDTYE